MICYVWAVVMFNLCIICTSNSVTGAGESGMILSEFGGSLMVPYHWMLSVEGGNSGSCSSLIGPGCYDVMESSVLMPEPGESISYSDNIESEAVGGSDGTFGMSREFFQGVVNGSIVTFASDISSRIFGSGNASYLSFSRPVMLASLSVRIPVLLIGRNDGKHLFTLVVGSGGLKFETPVEALESALAYPNSLSKYSLIDSLQAIPIMPRNLGKAGKGCRDCPEGTGFLSGGAFSDGLFFEDIHVYAPVVRKVEAAQPLVVKDEQNGVSVNPDDHILVETASDEASRGQRVDGNIPSHADVPSAASTSDSVSPEGLVIDLTSSRPQGSVTAQASQLYLDSSSPSPFYKVEGATVFGTSGQVRHSKLPFVQASRVFEKQKETEKQKDTQKQKETEKQKRGSSRSATRFPLESTLLTASLKSLAARDAVSARQSGSSTKRAVLEVDQNSDLQNSYLTPIDVLVVNLNTSPVKQLEGQTGGRKSADCSEAHNLVFHGPVTVRTVSGPHQAPHGLKCKVRGMVLVPGSLARHEGVSSIPESLERTSDHSGALSKHSEVSRGHSEPSSGHSEPSSGHSERSSGHSEPSSGHSGSISETISNDKFLYIVQDIIDQVTALSKSVSDANGGSSKSAEPSQGSIMGSSLNGAGSLEDSQPHSRDSNVFGAEIDAAAASSGFNDSNAQSVKVLKSFVDLLTHVQKSLSSVSALLQVADQIIRASMPTPASDPSQGFATKSDEFATRSDEFATTSDEFATTSDEISSAGDGAAHTATGVPGDIKAQFEKATSGLSSLWAAISEKCLSAAIRAGAVHSEEKGGVSEADRNSADTRIESLLQNCVGLGPAAADFFRRLEADLNNKSKP